MFRFFTYCALHKCIEIEALIFCMCISLNFCMYLHYNCAIKCRLYTLWHIGTISVWTNVESCKNICHCCRQRVTGVFLAIYVSCSMGTHLDGRCLSHSFAHLHYEMQPIEHFVLDIIYISKHFKSGILFLGSILGDQTLKVHKSV